MSTNPSRRSLLLGNLNDGGAFVRPPWARSEKEFVTVCERCDECMTVCPEKILVPGSGGFPRVDFAIGGCTFCGHCVKACDYQALEFSHDPGLAPWRLRTAIEENCLSLNGIVCRSCGEICEEQAISFRLQVGGVARPVLNETNCTGCGACVSTCPVGSINVSPSTGNGTDHP